MIGTNGVNRVLILIPAILLLFVSVACGSEPETAVSKRPRRGSHPSPGCPCCDASARPSSSRDRSASGSGAITNCAGFPTRRWCNSSAHRHSRSGDGAKRRGQSRHVGNRR